MPDVEFKYEYELEDNTTTWTVTMEFDSYVDHHYRHDADGNRCVSTLELQPEGIVIFDQNDINITPYIRSCLPELYNRITEEAEEIANAQAGDAGTYYDEDAWKGYD